MKGDVLVLSEHYEEELDNITYELLTKGREVADALGSRLAILLVGDRLESFTEVLANSGADIVLSAEHPILQEYNTEVYCKVISDAVKDFGPGLFLTGYTYLGMEIGPAVAVRLGSPMVGNCSDLELSNGDVSVIRPMFGGTLDTRVDVQGTTPYVVSFQKGVLPKRAQSPKPASVVPVPIEVDVAALRSKILGLVETAPGEVDITKASILVSVGRGIGDMGKIQIIRDLAEALGGAVACSRPVADMGWLPLEHQVGISAKTVAPKVYIACGISGASQHVAAMRDSSLIIAINKDPNAPIFGVAHYGVVGDLFDIVPAFIEAAR